ncbi:sigma-70 family RNA polymerase sigma factor [Aegicerativicinus sediminis]|uniref:sigma-70 family RNA polymerase sigma factor n=1 Tax=Aegicerativicinus sediminis TaxID=2893202 RepID=UPI001E649C20|nr:sigma-70 family RNA polymerase sigma factor [Aegicerativicinus sediminis]
MPKELLKPELWIDNYSDFLFHYTIQRVNDRELAKDIVQETFLAALNSMKNFKGEASERTWLVAILKRKIIDYYRRVNSKKGKAEVHIIYTDDEQEGDWLEEKVADPFLKNAEDKLENTELGEAIYKCLEKLPKKQAEAFKMKTILGYETETICNELDVTPSNFWVLIHRARTSLSQCMEENWF